VCDRLTIGFGFLLLLACESSRDYAAASADIGSPDGYQLQPVTIPQYGAGGGGGGGGRGGGGGGGGYGGDPMKGFSYLFAFLVFGM